MGALSWNPELTKHNQRIYAKEQECNQSSPDINHPTNDTNQSTHNTILDDEQHHCTVDFLKFVDDRHTLKQLALSIAKVTFLPAHTVFLIGLGIFASVACRRWLIAYKHGGTLPISLYLVAEQPSGAAKTRATNTFQKPFYTIEKEVKAKAKKDLAHLKKREKEAKKDGEPLAEFDYLEIARLERVIGAVLFATNATPEALEQSLSHSNGFFSAVSSEQGLFNTMLGACYSSDKVSNNDLLLNGYDGGYMGSMRIGRCGYTGVVVGGTVMFAQAGGIETLLKTSNGTGLAERFLLIAEKHNLGARDFTQTAIINNDLVEQYNALCAHFSSYILENPVDYAELASLDICADGWQKITEYRSSIEKHLADGGRYSHIALRGAAAKIDMQIMKIAANLHLLDNYVNETSTIALSHVKSAIGIAHAMIEANLKLCTDKGIIGVKAEYTAVLSLFKNGNESFTERKIIQFKSKTLPFKDFTGNKSELIRATLNDMVTNKILQDTYTPAKKEGGKPIKVYSLAQ